MEGPNQPNEKLETVKLQIVIGLALFMALLSGYTAASRLLRIEETRYVKLESLNTSPPVLDIEKAQKTEDLQQLIPRNILFTFNHYRATAAYITGEFTNWKAQPMKREGPGMWRVRLPILPGTYKYRFLAEGNSYRDKYNPRRSGNDSVLIVEPLKK